MCESIKNVIVLNLIHFHAHAIIINGYNNINFPIACNILRSLIF